VELLQKTIELFTKLFALLATLCFLFSIMFDWGYFSALGLSFSVVPTSLSDHLRSSLIWVPEVVASCLFASFFVLYLQKKIKLRTPIAVANSEDIKAQVDRRTKLKAPWILIPTAAPFVLLWLLLGDRFRGLLMLTLFIAWPVLVIYFTHGLADVRFVMWARVVLIFIPILTLGFYSMGQRTARSEIFGSPKLATVILKDKTGQSAHRLTILRTFEKVIIVKDAAGMITLVRTEDIVRVEGLSKPPFFSGLLCTWFNIGCKQAPQLF
jgi:hypothetical protein